MFPRNTLFYGDNLHWLRDRDRFPDACVDLIYLDPPFNSNRNYNVLFRDRTGLESSAQIRAFDDTWAWGVESEETFVDLAQRGFASGTVPDALIALRQLLGTNDLFAYLVMMTARLVELQRILKPTGSFYLHCDQTASHYLKMMLDSIFGKERFRGEITWKRTSSHSDAKKWSPVADSILYYVNGESPEWNPQYEPYSDDHLASKYRLKDEDGRQYTLSDMRSPNPRPNLTYTWNGHEPHPNGWAYSRETMEKLDAEGRIWYPDSKKKRPRLKRYLDSMPGMLVSNVWTDIPPLNARAAERLGFPTQKPLALLERIIRASSKPGDVVLDPFCGCGTTIDAAERLGRRWVGIDITILAVDLMKKRIHDTFGPEVASQIDVFGVPNEVDAARRLFQKDHFEFERWAVTLVNGEPHVREKQRGDRGIDGTVRFAAEVDRGGTIKRYGRALVSVKGGGHSQLNPGMVRDLHGTIQREQAEMGLLITLDDPTSGMIKEAGQAGVYTWPVTQQPYPRMQVVTVEDLMNDRKPKLPYVILPYVHAKRMKLGVDQPSLF